MLQQSLRKIVESIDVKIDEALPEKEIEDHEVEPFLEESEEEPEKEEKDEEPQSEPSQTPSKIKFLKKHHLEEQIVSNIDEGIQTRRRMKNAPRKYDVALLSLIECEIFSQARKDHHWIKAMKE